MLEAAEEQFDEMKRRLSVVRKEMAHSRDIAAADLAEARACHELLSAEGVVETNKKITDDLRVGNMP